MSHGRRRVVVTGAGVVSSLGDSVGSLAQALAAGRSGLTPLSAGLGDGLPVRTVGEIPGFDAARYLGDGANLRPLDRTGRLAAAAAELALEDAGWTPEARRQAELGLVLGTMFGSLHTIAAFDRRGLTAGPGYVKPLDFANTVINAAAGQVAIRCGLVGTNATVAGGTVAALQALAYAADAIAQGRDAALLAGGAEELSAEALLAFGRAGLLAGGEFAAEERPVPFAADRNGFCLGEAAALLVLEEEASAHRRGARVRAAVLGSGSAFDPGRGREPEAVGAALARAVLLALEDAEVEPGAVDVVSASASGSPAVDRAEALGLGAVLSEAVPVTAVKSMLGECLGASGALQTLALLSTFETGLLPPIHGLRSVAADCPLPGAGNGARAVAARVGLVTAVGLDGNVAALVLAHPGSP